ncbi:MAG: glycosyltransferase family 1 protein [Flavobacterium sp.]|nr:MAG: glycosyltransferase family 1 protein [Flavobacterium sp.]
MKIAVISSAPIIPEGGAYFAYSPYVTELKIWAADTEVAMACPIWESRRGLLVSEIPFPIAETFEVSEFNIKSVANILKALAYSFKNFHAIYRAMRWADHIHLRCPGNVTLMGCIVQILFPRKIKTAKYAGNWDPDAKQPLSYRIQKWILSNTFLTRNMSVLVYGEWRNSSKNIKPFFTATYRKSDKIPVQPRELLGTIRFVFVGMLSPGKRPLYAVQLIETLKSKGFDVALDFYGDGLERESLENYVLENALGDFVGFHGNQPENVVRKAFIESHFAVLPSKSEGWPKAIAEAMFWGCLPIASKVSCVPYMLGNGDRGVLIDINLEDDAKKLISLLENPEVYKAKVSESIVWSRQFTLDLFEKEIKNLLHR